MNRVALLLVVAMSAAAQAQTAAHTLSLRQAIDLAARRSPALRLQDEMVAEAGARERGARAQRFARVSADANILRWDKALQFDLGDVMLPAGLTFGNIRDQITSQVVLTLTQPLSGLFVIGKYIGVAEEGRAAAEADREGARLGVTQHVAEIYLRALEARAGLDVSRKSLAQIEAQLARAQILERGGTLGRVDVLRLQAARDNARQAVLKAQAAAATAGRSLALAIGLPPDPPVDVVDDLPDPPPPPPWTEAETVARALRRRPELRAAARRVAQAENGRQVALAGYLPDVNGVASYQHTEGQGTFQPKNAWYVGVTLHWNVWDWGRTGAGVTEAAHRKQQAAIAAASLADQVTFEARRVSLDAATAFATLDVTRSAVAAAEEAYRITTVRFEQGAATTTDLLDAETEVARARTGAALARYDYFIALAALARAAGEAPGFIP